MLAFDAIWLILECQMAGDQMSEVVTKTPRNGYTAMGLLGIRSKSNLDLAAKVEAGLSFSSMERFSKNVKLPLDDVRKAIRLTPRTMARRRSVNRLSPEESDRLVSVSRLFALTLELFDGRVANANRWFTSPNRALGRRSPLEVASTEVGSREVENLIGRIMHGVFS